MAVKTMKLSIPADILAPGPAAGFTTSSGMYPDPQTTNRCRRDCMHDTIR